MEDAVKRYGEFSCIIALNDRILERSFVAIIYDLGQSKLTGHKNQFTHQKLIVNNQWTIKSVFIKISSML